jgi:hypothetical protein
VPVVCEILNGVGVVSDVTKFELVASTITPGVVLRIPDKLNVKSFVATGSTLSNDPEVLVGSDK